jgi:hypothetical protein
MLSHHRPEALAGGPRNHLSCPTPLAEQRRTVRSRYSSGVKNVSKPRLSRHLRDIVVLSAATALLFWQLPNPFLRFSWPPLNYVGFIMGLILPWAVVVRCFQLCRWWATLGGLLLGGAVLIVSLFLGIGALVLISDVVVKGTDPSFEKVAEVNWKSSQVGLCRLNGGATTGYDIVIRHERRLFPGIVIVRWLDTLDSCSVADIRATTNGVSVRTGLDCGSPEKERTCQLKRFVYF